ncbi:TadE/TadG family type IV pilus assembly protein [Timonella senegalensis]|uniref:TadE/TadG family type IV pilus assembly protein n=1 Tax=Timonella senegalensis TaxID=1465825 RepID=UPI0002DFCA04|nr:TadE family protein [Timonella senegalensis]
MRPDDDTVAETQQNQEPESERGSATVEFALVLPAVVLVIGLLMSLVVAGFMGAAVQEESRTAARLAGVGASRSEILGSIATEGATLGIRNDGHWVTATVRAQVTLVGMGLPGVFVEGTSTAFREPALDEVQK